MWNLPRPIRFALLLALTSTLCCSPRNVTRQKDPVEERLHKLAAAYTRANIRLKRAPKTFEDIKADLEAGEASEDFLRSPADGEPFVILWGVEYNKLRPDAKDPFTVAAYEQRGRNGKRQVLQFPLRVIRLNDEELRKAVFPPGHKPPP
jgi:hypothetical protein